MITPEPPAGSEHYREGWRHGYEQAAIDRERSADAVRLVPETDRCDAVTTGIGGAPIGPCIRTAAHTVHEDRHGCTWWLTEPGSVPDTGHPTADARGASIWLGREDWGVVIDALIEHRASAQRRKAGNSESTSDVRGEVCDRIIGDLTGVLALPYGPAAVPDTGQARYQETACALRPAATSGDTDPLRASGRRFCEGDCSCGHDHERHGPEVPGCIECSCRITSEAPDA